MLELPFVSSKCVQCASPNLQNQWQLSGLARQPANLQFHSLSVSFPSYIRRKDENNAVISFFFSCDNVGPAIPDNMQTASCSTLCFEMVVPVGELTVVFLTHSQYHFCYTENQYHFVRGCHDDFTEKGVTAQQVRDEKCLFTNVTDQWVAVGDDGTAYAPAVSLKLVRTGTN